ncbi:hypothetical protein A2Y99_03965 [Candidatus Gottesmanbacteria bacterium RBG_13_37_7]|uniref:DUF2304 domain-containing protein n=1 Tax=Candidatus Gottesmanbacteria bacterium RBG_13_37_7 TaxID=1798369 RepID=A0A1F5YIE4_9BACT|nr:MAG: hypothetical protein A2Y99_03965 [Candidatus Gottesmanbacteria bacterium RBG_13_37_7]
MFTFTQSILIIFLLFALSRVILRFRGGNISHLGVIFWSLLFSSAIIFVIFPSLTGEIARVIGVGRGVDAIIYTSVVILFYLVFRLYVNLQDMHHQITKLVEQLALKEAKDKKNGKSSN